MTAPRKLDGIALKPRAKIPLRRKSNLVSPETKQESFDILRKVVEEHRELIDRRVDR